MGSGNYLCGVLTVPRSCLQLMLDSLEGDGVVYVTPSEPSDDVEIVIDDYDAVDWAHTELSQFAPLGVSGNLIEVDQDGDRQQFVLAGGSFHTARATTLFLGGPRDEDPALVLSRADIRTLMSLVVGTPSDALHDLVARATATLH